MAGLVLTRRGRLVRTVVLLVAVLALVALALVLVAHAPIAGLHVTDAQWRDGLAGAQWRITHSR